ncbi:Sec-independent protein translocase protein TatB, partial [Oharaeibacter diazotrophicus]
MLEIGWSEILVIAVVAIVVFPSKDLPKLLRTVGQTVGRVRRMAGDFQSQFNAALREAEREVDLEETRKQIQSVKDANPLTDVKRALDPLRNAGDEIRRSLTSPPPASDPRPPVGAVAVPNEPVKTGTAGETAAPEPSAI